MTESPNDCVESPCRQTGEWAFIGYLQVAKNQEQRVPIGVYSNYRDGKAHANAWMQTAGRAIRWEAEKLFAPIDPEATETPDIERTSSDDVDTEAVDVQTPCFDGTEESIQSLDPEPADEDAE